MQYEWDGDAGLGPLRLGMSLAEARHILPGRLQVGEDIGERLPFVYWDSDDETGLHIQAFDDVVTSITASKSFLRAGAELIGARLEAVQPLLKEVEGEAGDGCVFAETLDGLELMCMEDIVRSVTITSAAATIDAL